jgi:septum site-determining protein MinC
MQPTQLRIADVVARAPNTPPSDQQAEIAYVAAAGIRITRGLDFLKTHRFVSEQEIWEEFPI